jgi:competence protein ComEA
MTDPSKPVEESTPDVPEATKENGSLDSENPSSEPDEAKASGISPWALRLSDQTVVAVALGLAVLMIGLWCAVHWVRDGRLMDFEQVAAVPDPPAFRLDLNQADWPELAALPGIGEETARDITAFREENGPFRSVEDLDAVAGIGPKTLESIVPYLIPLETSGGGGDLLQPNSEDIVEVVVVQEDTSGRININVATQSQLEAAPGIGPVLAERILEYREQSGPFRRLEDVTRVSGIGEKTLEGLRVHFYAAEDLE